ncbi:MAG: hypothetical protein KAS72_15320 [Phycisphaerales bacterium]|nr:hypothetical protein [Phycisphaerales bacterium]
MAVRLGELLIQQGVLTRDQVDAILQHQQEAGRPFGDLAERMFGISPESIEQAWAKQYSQLTPTVDLASESFEPQAKKLVNRRQAWQFRILPIRFDGSELVIATTVEHLPRALNFVSRRMRVPCSFVIVDAEALGRSLCDHYAMPGMTSGAVHSDPFHSLLQLAMSD